MTRAEFIALPYLLTPGQAARCGYSLRTLDKYAENGLLMVVCPPGCTQRRFQKRQFAELLDWSDTLDLKAWAREKPLLSINAVTQWTGYDKHTILQILRAGGLVAVNPAGLGTAKYRKQAIGEWIGL